MRRAIGFIFYLFCGLALSACRIGEPRTMFVSMSAYKLRPVVVTQMAVNGAPLRLMPAVVRGKADTNRPRSGSGRQILSYPKGDAGVMQLDVTWVELPAGLAYRAQVSVPLDELEKTGWREIAFMPVFAPGGLLLVTSDPAPKSADDETIRDVLRICAARAPDADFDYTIEPGELPGLREALSAALTTPAPSTCE